MSELSHVYGLPESWMPRLSKTGVDYLSFEINYVAYFCHGAFPIAEQRTVLFV